MDRDFLFPFRVGGQSTYQMRRPDSLFQRPTLSQLLWPAQLALDSIVKHLPAIIRTRPRSFPAIGLYMKVAGVRIRMPLQTWRDVQTQVSAFSATRAIRRSPGLCLGDRRDSAATALLRRAWLP